MEVCVFGTSAVVLERLTLEVTFLPKRSRVIQEEGHATINSQGKLHIPIFLTCEGHGLLLGLLLSWGLFGPGW